MPKVTINKTPTEEVLAAAKLEIKVTDDKGRAINLRKPGVLAQYRLVEMLGDSARNEVYMGMVLPLLFVASIDGDETVLTSKLSVEALIQRLDEEGITAVINGVQEHFGVKIDPEADKAAIKK